MAVIVIEIETGEVIGISTIKDPIRSGVLLLDHTSIATNGAEELREAFDKLYDIVDEEVDYNTFKDLIYNKHKVPNKKKFTITAKSISYCTMEVEAETEEEAWEIGEEADGSEFTPTEKGGEWEIDRVELKEDE